MPRRVLLCWLLALAATTARGQAEDQVDFAHEVLPILRQHCTACHANGNSKGDLSMDTREALVKSEAIVPGDAEESELIFRVTSDEPTLRMPPKGNPLSAAKIATLTRWIDQGAVWQEGFSFDKPGADLPMEPRRPELPVAREGRTNPVDRFVDAYFAAKHADRTSPIDDAAFYRRVSLDLVGLLPTAEELDAFLADTSADKRAALVKRLLANDQGYAEHWLTFWNDLLRNDYVGTGYIDGGRTAITDWLYRSLRENKPYDQFVRELISPTPESDGFIKGIKWRGAINASQVPEIQFSQNVGQVFLGINLKCASCHDSFIDSWRLEDSYGLAAIIAEGPMEMYRCDKPTGRMATAKNLFPELGEIDPEQPRAERLRQLSEFLTSPKDGLLARTIVNRLWHRLMGRGIVHPVDVMAATPWSEDLLDWLASDLVEHGYDLKRTLELIATSDIYQRTALSVPSEQLGDESFVFRGPIARRLTAEEFLDAVWRITGTAPEKTAVNFPRDPEPVRASLVVASPLMLSLGRPNREQVVTTRPEELSTLQALDLTNGQELTDLLDRGAKGLHAAHPDWDRDQFTDWIFRSALSRHPSPSERETARAILGDPLNDTGLGDLLWSVFMLPDFQLIR